MSLRTGGRLPWPIVCAGQDARGGCAEPPYACSKQRLSQRPRPRGPTLQSAMRGAITPHAQHSCASTRRKHQAKPGEMLYQNTLPLQGALFSSSPQEVLQLSMPSRHPANDVRRSSPVALGNRPCFQNILRQQARRQVRDGRTGSLDQRLQLHWCSAAMI
jgi:hypothetical protein